MTPTTIQTAARHKYNSTGDTFFTDDEFFQLIWEAECQLAEEALVIENRYSTDAVANQREYEVPTLTLSIKRIEYDGQKLKYTSFLEDDDITLINQDTTDTGTPSYYQVFDRTIFLRPIPASSLSSGITLYTYDMPNLQTSPTATLDTPTIYHKDIVNYLVANMAAKDGNTNVAQYYMGMWQQGILRAKKWRNKRLSDGGPRTVKNADVLPNTYLGIV